jgi:hypothetical protein
MTRSRTLSRAVAAGLAIVAIAAPTALARPIQDLPTQAPQDLRMPDTKDAAALSQQRSDTSGVQTSSLAGTTSPKGDVYWSYDYPAQDPKTAVPPAVDTAPAPATDGGGSDTPWATIGIALAAALLGATGGAAMAGRKRRSGVAA